MKRKSWRDNWHTVRWAVDKNRAIQITADDVNDIEDALNVLLWQQFRFIGEIVRHGRRHQNDSIF